MKIIKLSASNLKRIQAVEIEPNGNLVVISGKNGAGKSSVLDSIAFALGGTKAQKDTPEPIRRGEKEADVVLELGEFGVTDLTVRRHWTAKGSTLYVEAADGAKYSSPQQVIDGLVGQLSFDPLAFAQQDPKLQLKTLLSLVELPFDPAELQAKRDRVYADRTDVNREVKKLELALEGSHKPNKGEKAVEEASFAIALNGLNVLQHQYDERKKVTDDLRATEIQIANVKQELAILEEHAEQARSAMHSWTVLADLDDAKASVAALEETNGAIRARNNELILWTQRMEREADAEKLTKLIEEIDAFKADAMANAKLPVAGLGFTDEGVTYNGLPFSQASSAEQLRVSMAMAMAMNPKLRVIRITDGSLLDSDNMALITEMAGDQDFQVWLERVEGGLGVQIEDGRVAVDDDDVFEAAEF